MFHDFVNAVWSLRVPMVWCPRASVVRCGVPPFSGCGMVTSAVHMTPMSIFQDFRNAVWSPRAHMVWCPRASVVRCGVPLRPWVWYGHLNRAYDNHVSISQPLESCMVAPSAYGVVSPSIGCMMWGTSSSLGVVWSPQTRI